MFSLFVSGWGFLVWVWTMARVNLLYSQGNTLSSWSQHLSLPRNLVLWDCWENVICTNCGIEIRVTCKLQEFHQHFQQEGNWFSQAGKTFWTELLFKIKLSSRWSNHTVMQSHPHGQLICLVPGPFWNSWTCGTSYPSCFLSLWEQKYLLHVHVFESLPRK